MTTSRAHSRLIFRRAQGIEKYFRNRDTVVKFQYEFSDETDTFAALSALETPRSSSGASHPVAIGAVQLLRATRRESEAVAFGFMPSIQIRCGAYGLAQGGDALANRFIKRIESLGGQVLTRKRVVSLEVNNQAISQIRTQDGDSFEADWVISGIHPKPLLAIVSDPTALTPAFRSRVANLEESIGLFGVYAACDPGIALEPRRNYYYFKNSDPRQFLKSEDATRPEAVFASSTERQSKVGASVLPVSLHAASPFSLYSQWQDSKYGARPPEYMALKEKIASNVLAPVERYEPGFRDGVRKWVSSTPLTNLHFNGTAEGSAYGIYHSIQNTGARALGPRTKILNLLLTGQNCLFPGILGASVQRFGAYFGDQTLTRRA